MELLKKAQEFTEENLLKKLQESADKSFKELKSLQENISLKVPYETVSPVL